MASGFSALRMRWMPSGDSRSRTGPICVTTYVAREVSHYDHHEKDDTKHTRRKCVGSHLNVAHEDPGRPARWSNAYLAVRVLYQPAG